MLGREDEQRLRNRLTLAFPDGRDAWATFQRQFDAHALYGFSVPIVTDDRLDAFVYYSVTCGPQCGQTGFVLLHRVSPDGVWKITHDLPKTIS